MSEETLRGLGAVLEVLLDGVLICALILIVLKAALYLFREGKITWLIQSFRIVKNVFFVIYLLLVGFFLVQMLFTSKSWDEIFHSSFIALVVLMLGFMFWIGPVNGILGIKFRKKGDPPEKETKNASKDGWVIESWTGDGQGEAPEMRKKENSGLRSH